MAYFTNEFLTFFEELSQHNTKEWFDEHRNTYEKFVKNPFKQLINDVIQMAQYHDPLVTMPVKNAIFRINRDIRFSKDKTPYKTKCSAIICHGPKKTHMKPGIYLEASSIDFRFYAGVYELNKEDLHKIREEINYNTTDFQSIYNQKDFINTFREIQGEKNKRIDKTFRETINEEPLIANKQFYVYKKLPASIIESDDLLQIITDLYITALPFLNFLHQNLEENN